MKITSASEILSSLFTMILRVSIVTGTIGNDTSAEDIFSGVTVCQEPETFTTDDRGSVYLTNWQ